MTHLADRVEFTRIIDADALTNAILRKLIVGDPDLALLVDNAVGVESRCCFIRPDAHVGVSTHHFSAIGKVRPIFDRFIIRVADVPDD